MFLATTGLRDFWDISRPILCLGDWCRRVDTMTSSSDNDWWLNVNVLKSDELSHACSYESYLYTIELYELLMPKMAQWLNQVHAVKHSLKYWQIVFGPFFLWYIQVVYYRYTFLKIAYELYPELTTIGMDAESYLTPINSREFSLLVGESDGFNLQLFTQIIKLKFSQISTFQKYGFEEEFKQREKIFGPQAAYKKLTQLKLKIVKRLAERNSFKTGLCAPMFERDFINKLVLKSKLRLLPLNIMERHHQICFADKPIHSEIRATLTDIAAKDEFSQLVLETLKINMPKLFVECYKEAVHISKSAYPYDPDSIVGIGLEDDIAKLWCANQSEKGTKLISIQHGGGYGTAKFFTNEYLEQKNYDKFLSWGWKEAIDSKVAIAPSLLICGKYSERNWHRKRNNNLILWAITETNRYPMQLESNLINYCQAYWDWQVRFANAVNQEILSKIVMRIRPASRYFNFLKSRLPNVNIHLPNNRGDYFDQLYKTKILISDNLGTVFHYSLMFNIPTIVYWDKNLWHLRDEAKLSYKELHSAGIYHETPEAAAKKLNEIANNPNEWWNSPLVQETREKFCNKYTLYSPTWVNEWKKILLSC